MNSATKYNLRYAVVDFLTTNLAFFLFNVYRYYCLKPVRHIYGSLSDFLSAAMPVLGQIIFPLLMMGVYYLSGVYSRGTMRSRTQELSTSVVTALIGTIMIFFSVLLNDLTHDRMSDYSLLAVLFVLLFGVVYPPRLFMTWRTNSRIASGEIGFDTLIVGYSSVPQLFPRQLDKIKPVSGMRPVALADADNKAQFCTSGTDLPIYDLDSAAEVCATLGIERIIVIPAPHGWDRTLDVINSLFSLGLPLFIAADDLPPFMFNARMNTLVSEPYIDIMKTRMSPATLNVKRAFDVSASVLMLLLSAVPVALAAIAVKLTSSGPAFYLQERVGRHRRSFNIIKLRTMYADSEASGQPELSCKGDTRVTPVGRFLRKYHIDELPQCINVIRGEMSLVGPRPERPYFADLIMARDPAYALIYCLRPGVTSLGMVNFGYASSVDQMVSRMKYDLIYLNNVSLQFDLKIIFHTVYTVISGRGV